MKRLFIIFIFLLILTTNVSAFCLFGLGNCERFVGVNPIFDDSEIPILEQKNLKEVIKYKAIDIEKEMPYNTIKIALPLKINVDVNDGEIFSVVIMKEGEIKVFKVIDKVDVTIHGNEEKLKDLFMTRTNQELINKITKLDIEAHTFKGMLIAEIIEDYLDIKNLVKNKSNTQKVIGVFTSPIGWFN